jgi:hypothetical protein
MTAPLGFKQVGQTDPLPDSIPLGFRQVGQAKGDLGDAIIEPIQAIAGNIGTEIAAGIGGVAQSLNPLAEQGAGAQAVEDIRAAAPDFSPQTEAGKGGMETIGQLVEAGIDIVNYPLSGLEGLSRLIKGQGIDQATQTIKDIQENGLGQNLGNRALEGTDSPLIATAAKLAPDIAGLSLLGPAGGAGIETAETIGRGLRAGVKPAIQTGKEIIEGAANFQTPATRETAKRLLANDPDKALAKFEVETTPKQLDAEGNEIPPTGIERFFDTQGPKVKTSPTSSNALKQGFREGVIRPIQLSSAPDKALMLKMTNIAETAKSNEKFGMRNRPGDVAGDLLMDRLNVVRKANKRAGQAIKPIVETMKGKKVNIGEVGASFSDTLTDMGITLTRGKAGGIEANFTGSNIEGLSGPENVINRVIKRIDSVGGSGEIDAAALHQLKKYIDEQVTFGKNAEGLAGETERGLKKLRADINKTLGEQFPAYAKANETYSGTIEVLDAFQDVAGRKMNLLGDNADKATGTLMRRLMSNAQSRITLLDAIDDIDLAVSKFGGYGGPLRIEGKGGAGNDLETLVLYADELDRVLGSAPRTSLQGQFDQAFGTAAKAAGSKGGAIDVAVDVAGKVIEKSRGINDENAIKAIKKLLNEK